MFTEWIISQLHTEWCDAWRDENSALCWHHCSVITHWKSCYLQTLLRLANSCYLCGSAPLSDFLLLSFSALPWEYICSLDAKYHYLLLSVCRRQENVLPLEKSVYRMIAYVFLPVTVKAKAKESLKNLFFKGVFFLIFFKKILNLYCTGHTRFSLHTKINRRSCSPTHCNLNLL